MPTQRVPTVALMSGDASLVAAQDEGQIFVWERATGRQRATIANRDIFRGAVAPGALAVVMDEQIKVWRGPRFARAMTMKAPRVLTMGRLSISADGSRVAGLYPSDGGVGVPDTAGVWEAASGKTIGTVRWKRGQRILGATLSRDGGLLAVFGDEPSPRGGKGRALLQVYRLGAAGIRPLLDWSSPEDRTSYCAAFSPRADRLALCAGERLVLWDLNRRRLVAEAATAKIKTLFPPPLRGPAVQMPGAHQVAFSPDGQRLLTAHAYGAIGVAVWSLAPLEPQRWLPRPAGGGTMRQVSWSEKGGIWLISSTYSPNVWVHEARGNAFVEARVLSP